MTRSNSNTGVKGIYQRNANRFEASFIAKRKNSGKMMTVHIGSYSTLDAAVEGKREYFNTL